MALSLFDVPLNSMLLESRNGQSTNGYIVTRSRLVTQRAHRGWECKQPTELTIAEQWQPLSERFFRRSGKYSAKL
jgi:hypothetical protein